MKITFILLSMVFACFCLLANPEKGKKKGGPSGDRPSREEIIKKFDKDGDGKLSDEEKAEARKTMMSKRKMPPFVIKKFDKILLLTWIIHRFSVNCIFIFFLRN